jgi:hypothetical protein
VTSQQSDWLSNPKPPSYFNVPFKSYLAAHLTRDSWKREFDKRGATTRQKFKNNKHQISHSRNLEEAAFLGVGLIPNSTVNTISGSKFGVKSITIRAGHTTMHQHSARMASIIVCSLVDM